jgi:hypothetical protein
MAMLNARRSKKGMLAAELPLWVESGSYKELYFYSALRQKQPVLTTSILWQIIKFALHRYPAFTILLACDKRDHRIAIPLKLLNFTEGEL